MATVSAMHRVAVTVVAIGSLAICGCGSVRTAAQSGGENAQLGGAKGFGPYQPRDRFVECARGLGLQVNPIGQDTAQLLPAATGARVVFAVDMDAATVLQIRGQAEGAEQIGQAVVYSSRASDSQIEQIQNCL